MVPQEAVLRLEYYCEESAVISEFNNMKLDLESWNNPIPKLQ